MAIVPVITKLQSKHVSPLQSCAGAIIPILVCQTISQGNRAFGRLPACVMEVSCMSPT